MLTALSLVGLLFPSAIYPSADLRRAFLANDVVNLLIGLPVLVVSMLSARRGGWTGRLFWLGALLYVIYNAIAYAVALFPSWIFPLHAALLILSLVTLVGVFTSWIFLTSSIDCQDASPNGWRRGCWWAWERCSFCGASVR